MATNTYVIEYAKSGRSKCHDKKCEDGMIAQGVLRIGKVGPNRFSEGDTKTDWFHAKCIFSALTRARPSTKKIESVDDLAGFDGLEADDQAKVKKYIEDKDTSAAKKGTKRKASKKKKDDDDDGGDDEKKKPKKKPAKKKDDDEDDDDKKKAKKKTAKKKDDNDDDDGGSDKKKAKKKAASPSPKKKKKADSDAEDGSDDDAPKKKKQKKSPAKKPAKSKSDNDDDGGDITGKQYYEADGKFWEITVDGNDFTTRYGKIGAAGQEKTKTVASAEKAQKEAQKLVRQKLAKGYERQDD